MYFANWCNGEVRSKFSSGKFSNFVCQPRNHFQDQWQ
jgi:hypothetical protein